MLETCIFSLNNILSCVIYTDMNISPPSSAPSQAEPHQAARLAELVGSLLGVILRAWWWRLVPGGRAMQARLRRQGAAFVALMRGIAEAAEATRLASSVEHQLPPLDPLSRLRPANAGGERTPQRRFSALSRAWRRAVGDACATDEDEWVLVRVACGAWPIRRDSVGIAYPAPEPAVPWPRAAWVRLGAV